MSVPNNIGAAMLEVVGLQEEIYAASQQLKDMRNELKDAKHEVKEFMLNGGGKNEYNIDNRCVISMSTTTTKDRNLPFGKSTVEELLRAYFQFRGIQQPEREAKMCRDYIVGDQKGSDKKLIKIPSRPMKAGGEQIVKVSYKVMKQPRNQIMVKQAEEKQN